MIKKTFICLSLIVVVSLTGCGGKIQEVEKTKTQEEKAKPISKEDLVEIAKQADYRLIDIVEGYDQSNSKYHEEIGEDGNNRAYHNLREDINSYEDIRGYLSPYWSKELIEDFLKSVTKEVDGVAYVTVADELYPSDFDNAKNIEVEEIYNFKILSLDIPYSFEGELDHVHYEYIFEYRDKEWQIYKTNSFPYLFGDYEEVIEEFDKAKKEISTSNPKSETKENKEIKEEEFVAIVKEGTDRLVEVMSGYKENPDIYEFGYPEKQQYYNMKDKFNSYEKIESYLDPYWSKEIIRSIFTDKYTIKDSELYLQAGDIGGVENFNDIRNIKLEKIKDFIILKMEAPIYGDDPTEYEPSGHILIKENGNWVIDATTYYGVYITAGDDKSATEQIFNETEQAIRSGQLTRGQAKEAFKKSKDFKAMESETALIDIDPYKLYKGEKHYSFDVLLDAVVSSYRGRYLVNIKNGNIVNMEDKEFDESELENISGF